MDSSLIRRIRSRPSGLAAAVGRLVLLLLPALLLAIAALRFPPANALMLWLGTAFQVLVCLLSLLSPTGWRQPLGPSLITLYIIALGWLFLGAFTVQDWYRYFAQALLLVVPLIAFGHQILTESGASALRRARLLADQLGHRKNWPADLAACRTLPEVKALREAIHADATPALALLSHPRPEVRIAALAALEFRQNWKRGQAEIVLQLAQAAPEPAVRGAAITALANIQDRILIEVLAEYLRDPSPEVRKAANEALLWDSERRWSWIRHALRRCLGDPALQADGSLLQDGQTLHPEGVADLTAWAAEKGVLGVRAALMLGAHYSRTLSERTDPHLLADLRRQLSNPRAPAALRLELAGLLQHDEEMDHDLLEKLLDTANPAPLRLMAVDALLAEQPVHMVALGALNDLARLPNREIALATASVVQRRLGVDLGLPPGQPLPPCHSRQAAEIARRVMAWAAQQEHPCLKE